MVKWGHKPLGNKTPLAYDMITTQFNHITKGGSTITVRNIADIHEEELDECEAKNTKLLMADHYSQGTYPSHNFTSINRGIWS